MLVDAEGASNGGNVGCGEDVVECVGAIVGGIGVATRTIVGWALRKKERHSSRHCWLMSGRTALTSRYRKTMIARSCVSLFIVSS